MKKKFEITALMIGIFLFIIDQILKIYVVQNISEEGITVITNMLKLSFVQNTGASFGIGGSNTMMIIASNLIILGIVINFMVNQRENMDKKTFFSLTLILIGGMSNLIDRIFRGYVVDYINITEFMKFPLFNIADMCINIGAILLIIAVIINTRTRKEKLKI